MQVVQYKCPSCGGDITYTAEAGCFVCEYCDSRYSFEEVANAHKKNENIDLTDREQQERADEFTSGSALYRCPSCGSEIIAENSNTLTLNCYYCHSPVTLVGRLSGEYKPDYIIPFTVSRNQADNIFKDFCKDKAYLPDDFNDGKVLEKITGVYVPFWLGKYAFNAQLTANCQKRKSIGGKRVQIKEYLTRRSAVVYYDNVPADGSRMIDDTLMDALQPYKFSEMQDFSMSYLSGYMAEKYDIPGEEALQRQYEEALKNSTETIIKDLSKKYQVVNVTQSGALPQFASKKYALLPVWFLAYRYNGKVYQYGVNGQTGKISGSIPINKKKFNLHTLIYGLVGGFFGLFFAFIVFAIMNS